MMNCPNDLHHISNSYIIYFFEYNELTCILTLYKNFYCLRYNELNLPFKNGNLILAIILIRNR